MDIHSREFRTLVDAGANWMANHPKSSLGTTAATGDFDSFCDALEKAMPNFPTSDIGLVLHHSYALLTMGDKGYEEKLKYLNTFDSAKRGKPAYVEINNDKERK